MLLLIHKNQEVTESQEYGIIIMYEITTAHTNYNDTEINTCMYNCL